ncbi:hypothetical protein TNCV_1572741 [Trichonephila clavipes]|uniref:Uncharacterized protein n=1 Tax=Trichonephila clavipes TaxID=2585209 RepID=A0A8X6SPX8_TRICX|nr:hypothetical protein TNCV_1572741 [Trichonephila clavipes]
MIGNQDISVASSVEPCLDFSCDLSIAEKRIDLKVLGHHVANGVEFYPRSQEETKERIENMQRSQEETKNELKDRMKKGQEELRNTLENKIDSVEEKIALKVQEKIAVIEEKKVEHVEEKIEEVAGNFNLVSQ